VDAEDRHPVLTGACVLEPTASLESFFAAYAERLGTILRGADWSGVALLARDMQRCWAEGRQVFLCGNGGSAGNAIHLANDFLYGVAKRSGGGMKVMALSANPAVITCLANDVGFDLIYSEQLAVQANEGDVLVVLSGSGNSANIVKVLEQARAMRVRSYALLGYAGGRARELADIPIHFAVNDMQIAEDLQLIIGHMLMQWLYSNRPQSQTH
jgi:D-sedoheptulose 7-phosphate isomerase